MAAPAFGQGAGTPRDQAQAQQPASGIIAGTVSAGDSGRPLRRVRIVLEDERVVPKGFAVTDDQGRFALTQLPAGSYILKASRTGFLEVIYGQRKPGSGRSGTPIQLADGQRVEKLSLVLPRGGLITGVVTDEVGDPASNVTVRAVRRVLRNGERAWVPAVTASTSDDRGQFRLFGLLPGEYLVCATPRDELATAAAQAEAMRRRMDDIKAAAGRGGATPETKMMIDRMNAAALPEAPKAAYVPACAPGTMHLSEAATVSLDAGEERPGVNLQLPLVPIARVSGTITWSGGQVPVGNTTSDTYVSLTTPEAVPGIVSYGMHVPADGRFSIVNVPPGSYRVTARAMGGKTALWASTEITVSGQPVSDLLLTMQPGLSVTGRVVVEGAAPVDVTKIRITALLAGEIAGETAPVVASPDADGRFTLEGVVPARYRIGAYPGSAGAANLKSSVFGGRDTLDFPLDVRPGEPIEGGVITIVPRLADITGQLRHDANQPATGFTVIVFTADLQYWTPQSRRIQGVRPATDGRFAFRNLPAGEYRLVAVTDVEPGQWFDPAFLKELLPASIPLALSEGERKEQTLQVVKR